MKKEEMRKKILQLMSSTNYSNFIVGIELLFSFEEFSDIEVNEVLVDYLKKYMIEVLTIDLRKMSSLFECLQMKIKKLRELLESKRIDNIIKVK